MIQFIWEFLQSMGLTQSRQLPEYRKIRMGKSSWRAKPGCESTMFLDEESSDVAIFVRTRDGASRFPCHHAVVRAHMPTLDRAGRRIAIENHTPEAVEQVLRFVYKKPVHLEDWRTARDVLVMAKNYEMDLLIKECQKVLEASITLRNVCYILELSSTFYLPDLTKKCQDICNKIGFSVLKTKAFMETSRHIVRTIVSSPDLNVKNEMSVFEALWSWSKFHCIKNSVLLEETNILEEAFVHVSDCVGFEFLTPQQKTTGLPQRVQDRYCERISVNPEIDPLPDNLLISRPRQFRLESLFTLYQEPLLFNVVGPASDSVRGSHVACIKFSLDVDAILLGFITLCLDKKGQSETSVEQLSIIGPSMTLLKWESVVMEIYVRAHEIRRRTISDPNSTIVRETHFKANAFLKLKAGTVYELKIVPRESNVEWPRVEPHWDDSKFDRNISIHSKKVYGLGSITFMQPA